MGERRLRELLGQYDSERQELTDYCRSVEDLVARILISQGQRVHTIEARVKGRDSLERKLRRGGRIKYGALADVTDLVGLRIITHFSDEVDAVASIVEQEFAVDHKNSLDRRATIEPDRFGYLSLHYVVSINEGRSALTEYKRFSGRVCEIQVRSILQHAWAEIEHDLGYKATASVPKVIRRRFSRLAGLLEIADEEFLKVRDELTAYTQEVESRLARRETESVLVDHETVKAFMTTSPVSVRIRDRLVAGTGAILINDPEVVEHEADDSARRLIAAGYRTLEEVETALERYESEIIEFALAYLGSHPRDSTVAQVDDESSEPSSGDREDGQATPVEEWFGLGDGISLFYLCYVGLIVEQGVDALRQYLAETGSREIEETDWFARWLCDAYRTAVVEKKPLPR